MRRILLSSAIIVAHCKKNPAPIQLSQSFSFGGLGARVYVEEKGVETKTK